MKPLNLIKMQNSFIIVLENYRTKEPIEKSLKDICMHMYGYFQKCFM